MAKSKESQVKMLLVAIPQSEIPHLSRKSTTGLQFFYFGNLLIYNAYICINLWLNPKHFPKPMSLNYRHKDTIPISPYLRTHFVDRLHKRPTALYLRLRCTRRVRFNIKGNCTIKKQMVHGIGSTVLRHSLYCRFISLLWGLWEIVPFPLRTITFTSYNNNNNKRSASLDFTMRETLRKMMVVL